MESVSLKVAKDLMPDGLWPLVEQADREGIRNMRTLLERWVSAEEIYDGPGEVLLAAVSGADAMLGVGGITRCPTVPGALRVRRFYVHPQHRRSGIAAMIATTLVTEALKSVSMITCNAAASAAAPPFWEAMGFTPVDVDGITHVLRR